MRFKVDLKIFIFLILFFFTKQIYTYVTIIFFAIIHELGHLATGLILGMKPEKIEITPYGVSISFKLMLDDYNKRVNQGNILEIKKIIVALAGPVTNLFIILITHILNLDMFSTSIIIYTNVLLIIFNLLPIYPLDGGRILKGTLHIIFGKRKSERYINNISFISVIVLTLVSSILIYSLKNISIFLIILFLWCVFIKQDIVFKRRCKIYDLVEKTIENN